MLLEIIGCQAADRGGLIASCIFDFEFVAKSVVSLQKCLAAEFLGQLLPDPSDEYIDRAVAVKHLVTPDGFVNIFP